MWIQTLPQACAPCTINLLLILIYVATYAGINAKRDCVACRDETLQSRVPTRLQIIMTIIMRSWLWRRTRRHGGDDVARLIPMLRSDRNSARLCERTHARPLSALRCASCVRIIHRMLRSVCGAAMLRDVLHCKRNLLLKCAMSRHIQLNCTRARARRCYLHTWAARSMFRIVCVCMLLAKSCCRVATISNPYRWQRRAYRTIYACG